MVAESDFFERIFQVSSSVRYAALYRMGQLSMRSRGDLLNASSSESDRYEELLVNPTLLTLARQRGEIDCGGLEFLLVRYGSFYQFVIAVTGGHVSICLEPDCDPPPLITKLRAVIRELG